VLARDFKLPALVLDLVEKPHILDGDHGLVGKGVNQFDLLVSKGPHLFATQKKNTDWCPFSHQRNPKCCAQTLRSLNVE